MAADLLEFTQANMGFSPFLLPNAPAIDPVPYGVSSMNASEPQAIEIFDYMAFNEGAFEELSPSAVAGNAGSCSGGIASNIMECERDVKRMKMSAGHRIGFRTKSEVEILDDGFKWRKYGKKSVKNSPNPRNYYRCSSEGCGVKKRVERDREDNRYVVTTYEGIHNHPSPGTICCSYGGHHHHQTVSSSLVSFGGGQVPVMAPNPWSTVQSPNSSC